MSSMEPTNPSKKKTRVAINGGLPILTRKEVEGLLHRRDLKDFKLPRDFDQIDWSSIEFLAWKHPSGHRGYILECENGKPRVWVLECETKSSNNTKPVMCSLCNSIQSGTGTRAFGYRPDNNRNKIVGFYLCSDLACVDNVNKINSNSMRETITPEKKRERMVENLHHLVTVWDEANQKND